jgi:hypothetical protein
MGVIYVKKNFCKNLYLSDMKLLNILSEIVLINENLAMAKKWLMMYDIPEDDPDFVKVKDYLAKNNSLGYLGYVLKFTKNYGLYEALGFAEYILENKEFIKLLPKDIANYSSFDEFGNDIDKLKKQRKIKNFTKKFTNKKLIALLLQTNINVDNEQNIDYFLSIESGDQKEFLSKSDKYDNVETFLNELSEFVEDHKIGFKYNVVLDKIKSMSNDDIKVLLSKNNMILAIIKTYAASAEIGSKSWCIVGDEGQFNKYTKDGNDYQYFFFNFNSGIPINLKMIAFTMDADNEITHSHDRYDEPFSKPLNYLKSIGVTDEIFRINSRVYFERLIKKKPESKYGEKVSLVYAKRKTHDGVRYWPINNFESDLKIIAYNAFKILKKSKGSHLDLIVKKFENYPTELVDYDDYDSYRKIYYIPYNVLIYMIDNYGNYDYDSSTPENLRLSKDEFIDILKKIYQSNINIKQETKLSILKFLKDNDVDILTLARFKKVKRGEDLTASEFGMLAKRGENLTPIVQNKLAAIRRGEDVSMSETEINYAIENGYKNIIMKYYKNNLPYYSENQLTYEDLNIYKKLGLINDITSVIKRKGDTWGVDSLNSIENSVYGLSKMLEKT